MEKQGKRWKKGKRRENVGKNGKRGKKEVNRVETEDGRRGKKRG